MARRPRPDLPGVAFHLTTRLQGKAHLLTPGLRTRIVQLLRRKVLVSDVRLLAYVVMTNHLHLVLVQGESRLDRFMQPFLRSAALAIQRRHGLEGHVFERRFRDTPCRSEEHLRAAIGYTHANPVRAGLCRTPGEYRWSSHTLYEKAGFAGRARVVDVRRGLEAFTPPEAQWRSAGRSFYVSFLSGILPGDGAEPPALPRPPEPLARGPDEATPGPDPRRRPLHELVRHLLESREPTVTLDLLRSRYGPRRVLPIRNAIIRTLGRAGYSGREIAAFFGLSESAVSRILTGQAGH